MKKTQGKIEKLFSMFSIRRIKMEKKSYLANANKVALPYSNIQIRVHETKTMHLTPCNVPSSPKSPVTDNKVSFHVENRSPTEPQISKVYTKSLQNYNHFVNKNNQHLEKLNLV